MFEKVKNIAYVGERYCKTLNATIPVYEIKMKREVEQKCPHCDNCFACPLPDCKINTMYATGCNVLPNDKYMHRTKERRTR